MSTQTPRWPGESGDTFHRRWLENARHLTLHGLYDPAQEHASCGVGLVASTDGKPSRRVVESGIMALKKIWHRGAVDADGKTGDGQGDGQQDIDASCQKLAALQHKHGLQGESGERREAAE